MFGLLIPELANKFGVLESKPVTMFEIAFCVSRWYTVLTLLMPSNPMKVAMMPATIGLAILVPDIFIKSPSFRIPTLAMLLPGAIMLTDEPKFDHQGFLYVSSLAATQMVVAYLEHQS